MTSRLLFHAAPYAREASAKVVALTDEGGIVLDQTVFYPTSGGQPGDSGRLVWGDRELGVGTTIKGPEGAVILLPSEPSQLPKVGDKVAQRLDWDRRYRHMKVHTALHLLSVVIPLPVTGGSIAPDKGRLDFDMPEAPEDRDALEAELNRLIAADLPVIDEWITEAELDANPSLVKTMSVQPPRGTGRIRLVRIGEGAGTIDLQPCGGTHVARTGEIGPVTLGKVEKKGKQNRRVYLHLGA